MTNNFQINCSIEELKTMQLPRLINFIYHDVEDSILLLSKNEHNVYVKYKSLNPIMLPIKWFMLGGFISYVHDEFFHFKIGKTIKNEKRDFKILDRKIKLTEGKNSSWRRKYYYIKCNKCTYEFWRDENKLKNFTDGCACCCPTPQVVVRGINDITTTDPWMIPYFQGGGEEASQYTSKSNKKIYPKCPDCGEVRNKLIAINKINIRHSIGCKCSDKKSYPNKFSYAFLEQLPIENWETEYSPDWLRPYLYDNYFEYNGNKYVLEFDGSLGHGNKQYKNKKWIKDEDGIKRDIIKDNLAKENNVIVIRIDAQQSVKEYIVKNILSNKTLVDIFGEALNNINWDICNLKATKNIIKEVCEYWENNNHCEYKILKDKFHINYIGTIQDYLKRGNVLGWCNYDKQSYRKERQEKTFGHKINVFLEDGTYIKTYPSKQNLCKSFVVDFGTKMSQGKVNDVLNGKIVSYKGFLFKEVLEER